MVINYFSIVYFIFCIIAVHHSFIMFKRLKTFYIFSTSETNLFNSEELNKNNGLLDSVKDISMAKYFSNNINIDRAYELISDEKFIYNAAVRDAKNLGFDISEYLERAVNNSRNFLDSKTLWDREDLTKKFQDIISYKGQLVCFLGGKSVGKSFLVNHIESNFSEKVFLIDMRGEQTIMAGLLKSLRKKINNLEKFVEILNKCYDNAKLAQFPFYGLTFTAETASSIFPTLTLENLIEIIIEKMGPITLIIDEANKVFDSENAGSITTSRDALALFVKLTKQDKKINVILVSSEYTFPFQLTTIGMNIVDIQNSIFASELAPKDIYKLLTEIWEIGPELSIALISVYGGHVYNIYNALNLLSEKKNNFIGTITPLQSNNIEKCISDCNEDKEMEKKMLDVLERLAVSGFCPSAKRAKKYADRVEQIISLNNVGAVVSYFSYIQGVPEDIWNGLRVKTGIVPTDQAIRLAIVEFLWEMRNNS